MNVTKEMTKTNTGTRLKWMILCSSFLIYWRQLLLQRINTLH